MPEITLEFAQALYNDRINELRSQVKDGTPWVFIGAISLFKGFAKRVSPYVHAELFPLCVKLLGQNLSTSTCQWISKYEIDTTFGGLSKYEKQNNPIAMTHQPELHNKTFKSENGNLITVCDASSLVEAVASGINSVFEKAKTDTLLASQLYCAHNELSVFPTLHMVPKDDAVG